MHDTSFSGVARNCTGGFPAGRVGAGGGVASSPIGVWGGAPEALQLYHYEVMKSFDFVTQVVL